MSNHKFIQVEPPKEELTLPVGTAFGEFTFTTDSKSKTIFKVLVSSPTPIFTGMVAGDFIEASTIDPITLIETKIGTFEISTAHLPELVESTVYDRDLESTTELLDRISTFKRPNIIPKLYKLPDNNFSLQVKTDSIVRYYEDPVDKTIMYLDVLESPSICGNGGPGVCVDIWGHDRASLGIVTLNNTDKIPMHNIVPYLNSIFLGADDEN